MKLQCQVDVVNRLHNNLNIRTAGKYLKSTLAIGKEPKSDTEHFILHFSSVNRTGTKYRVKCIKQVFVRCLNEGKATLRFEEPPHDLCIRSETIQLKCFMRILKLCITGNTKDLQLGTLSNISVTSKDNAPTKLVITCRSEFPISGLPRTLESLYINGLSLCNFRRDILLLKLLTVLDLGNNEIDKIPPEFGRMPNLTELHLANNKLGVKKEADWRWLLGPQLSKKLKLLDLSGNLLQQLPKSIWKLQQLVTLKVDNNMLQRLPTPIGRISSLRYLTVSKNELTSLPCSLMQCKLEYLDVSSNNFNCQAGNSEWKLYTRWEFYIGNLVHMASKIILKNKLYYAANTIPWTLVEFLDNANICVCGSPVVNGTHSKIKEFELKDYFRVVVFDNNRSSMVAFECYYCSPKCFER